MATGYYSRLYKAQLINPPALPSVAADAANVYSLTLVQPTRLNTHKCLITSKLVSDIHGVFAVNSNPIHKIVN